MATFRLFFQSGRVKDLKAPLYVTWQLSYCYVEFFIWHDVKVTGQRHALGSFFLIPQGRIAWKDAGEFHVCVCLVIEV